MILFVYGTLRRGEPNHAQLRDARYIGRARTEARYELVDLGGYPALLERGDTSVTGELYEVDDALLSQLDEFEEVPLLYERKRVAIADAHSGKDAALAYVMPRERAGSSARIGHGDWCAPAP